METCLAVNSLGCKPCHIYAELKSKGRVAKELFSTRLGSGFIACRNSTVSFSYIWLPPLRPNLTPMKLGSGRVFRVLSLHSTTLSHYWWKELKAYSPIHIVLLPLFSKIGRNCFWPFQFLGKYSNSHEIRKLSYIFVSHDSKTLFVVTIRSLYTNSYFPATNTFEILSESSNFANMA